MSHWVTSVASLITQWDTQHSFVKKSKVFTDLYLYILIFNNLHFKNKLVNCCSDDNLNVVLWHFQTWDSLVYFLLCTHALKWPGPQVWVLGTTHLNTFKSGMLLLLPLSTLSHPTSHQHIFTTFTQVFKCFKCFSTCIPFCWALSICFCLFF